MRREWKIRFIWLALGIAIGCIPMCSNRWDVNACLEQGGEWNEDMNACEF